jgi:hypothetical protein
MVAISHYFVCALKWNVSIKLQLEQRSVLDIMTLVMSMNEMVVIWVICNHESEHESIRGKKLLFVSLASWSHL